MFIPFLQNFHLAAEIVIKVQCFPLYVEGSAIFLALFPKMLTEFVLLASACQSGEILMEVIAEVVKLGPNLQNNCAPVARC